MEGRRKMSKKNKKGSSGLFRRLFMGKRIKSDENVNNVEEIVSPGKQIVHNFFERKLAVFALCVVIGMFLFVFIGPLFMPNYMIPILSLPRRTYLLPCP